MIQGDPDRPVARGGLQCADNAPEGEVALLSFASEVAEARGIATLTQDLITRRGIQPSQILILMRSDHNSQFSKRIKAELEARDIAFSNPDAVNEILEHEPNRRALSLMRLAINREDSLAWVTLLHLAGGIGGTFIDYIYDRARDARSTFGRALMAEFGNGFVGAPRSSARAATIIESAIKWVEEYPVPEQMPEDGWANWISDTFPAQAEITSEFRELLRNVDERIEETDNLGSYLGQVGPLARDLALARSDGVRIMTLAGSKGLTVEAAILCGLESGLVPMDGADLAEERRLLYVGITRAKRFLFGTWARLRRGPTARAGRGLANERRRLSIFLDNGPMPSQDGNAYLAE